MCMGICVYVRCLSVYFRYTIPLRVSVTNVRKDNYTLGKFSSTIHLVLLLWLLVRFGHLLLRTHTHTYIYLCTVYCLQRLCYYTENPSKIGPKEKIVDRNKSKGKLPYKLLEICAISLMFHIFIRSNLQVKFAQTKMDFSSLNQFCAASQSISRMLQFSSGILTQFKIIFIALLD